MNQLDFYSEKEVWDFIYAARIYSNGYLREVKINLLRSVLRSGRLSNYHSIIVSRLIAEGIEVNQRSRECGFIADNSPVVEGVVYQIYNN